MMRKLSLSAACAASLLFAACGPAESGTITIELLHNDCLGNDMFPSAATQLEIAIEGPGLAGEPVTGKLSAKTLDISEIPAGKDRVVVARATDGAADRPTVWAFGRSEPFDVEADQSQTVQVKMVGLNQVRPTATEQNQCTESGPRAGHAVAAFQDGRALLVGGFVIGEGATGPTHAYLDTVEMYEPATGTFRALGSLPAICGPTKRETCERAFAPAVVQDLGGGRERLLVVGGEYADQDGRPLARGEILAFDPQTEEWSRIDLKVARRYHTATVLGNGAVFILGGFGNPTEPGEPVPVVGVSELLEKTASETKWQSTPEVPRALHAAVATGHTDVIVAGGVDDLDNSTPLPVVVQRWNAIDGTKIEVGQLAAGLIGPSLAVHADHVAVLGGVEPDVVRSDITDLLRRLPHEVGPQGSAHRGRVFPPGNGSAHLDLPQGFKNRSFACTVPIDANSTMIVGGLTTSGDVLLGDGTVEVLTWIDQAACVPTEANYETECAFGSVLVANQCRAECTEDAQCRDRGVCVDGYCAADLSNPDHRCANDYQCFAGSKCRKGGQFEQTFIGGRVAQGSRLLRERAWAGCTRLSDDQILITGGATKSENERTLGAAEIYEIPNAGR